MKVESEYQDEGSARVAWLERVYRFFNEELFSKDCPYAANISWGWPSSRAKTALGEASELLKDANSEFLISISPLINDTTDLLDTLVHEMVHLAVGTEYNHGKVFSRYAKKVGLQRPWRTTSPSERLKEMFKRTVIKFGDFPKGYVQLPKGKKKQGTRLRLYTCRCEIKIRVASDDLDVTCYKCMTVFMKAK